MYEINGSDLEKVRVTFEKELEEEMHIRRQIIAGVRNKSRDFQEQVCKHWLRGLCKSGDFCTYLHVYDLSKMPLCGFYNSGQCKNPDVRKHFFWCLFFVLTISLLSCSVNFGTKM